ncbi:hypothetical protein NHQ30_011262 [Ciborinia camelliae]|nr:hypothetical protein NHQ30_011262 [Ciborinia camelliae]
MKISVSKVFEKYFIRQGEVRKKMGAEHVDLQKELDSDAHEESKCKDTSLCNLSDNITTSTKTSSNATAQKDITRGQKITTSQDQEVGKTSPHFYKNETVTIANTFDEQLKMEKLQWSKLHTSVFDEIQKLNKAIANTHKQKSDNQKEKAGRYSKDFNTMAPLENDLHLDVPANDEESLQIQDNTVKQHSLNHSQQHEESQEGAEDYKDSMTESDILKSLYLDYSATKVKGVDPDHTRDIAGRRYTGSFWVSDIFNKIMRRPVKNAKDNDDHKDEKLANSVTEDEDEDDDTEDGWVLA